MLSSDNTIVHGNVGTVTGDNCRVGGNVTLLSGDNCVVGGNVMTCTGDNNRIEGNVVQCTGDRNIIKGNVTNLSGNNNRYSGRCNNDWGEGNRGPGAPSQERPINRVVTNNNNVSFSDAVSQIQGFYNRMAEDTLLETQANIRNSMASEMVVQNIGTGATTVVGGSSSTPGSLGEAWNAGIWGEEGNAQSGFGLNVQNQRNTRERREQLLRDQEDETTEIESEQCIICVENKKRIVAIPCQHRILCKSCYLRLEEKKCPECRKEIDQVIDPYN
jgi:hypothetical protein